MAANVKANLSGNSGGHVPNPDRLQNMVLRIVEAEKELDLEIDRLLEVKLEIAQTIAEVENMNQRTVLEKRYLCFMNGRQIAEEMNYSLRWVRLQLAEALETVQKILDREETDKQSLHGISP